MDVHSCTWPIWRGGVTGCNTRWGVVMCGELTSSHTFAGLQVSDSAETPALGRIQTPSFSTVFIDYS